MRSTPALAFLLLALGTLEALGQSRDRARPHAGKHGAPAPERLVDRTRRPPPAGRRSAARHGRIAGRSLPGRDQRRLHEALARRDRPRAIPGARPRSPGECVAGSGLPPRWPTVLLLGGGRPGRRRARLRAGSLEATGAIALPSAVEGQLRRRPGREPGRQAPLRPERARATPSPRSTSSRARSSSPCPCPRSPTRSWSRPMARPCSCRSGAGPRCCVIDAATLAVQAEIAVGEHPSAMVLTPDGRRLFVACASTNAVWVVDVAERRAPRADQGRALSRGAARQHAERRSACRPTARPCWWRTPTTTPWPWSTSRSRAESRSRASSPPAGTRPRPASPGTASGSSCSRARACAPRRTRAAPRSRSTSASFSTGRLSRARRRPTPPTLAAYTKTVYRLTPYTDATRLAPAGAPERSPIPRKVGEPSPIKHVFYVIRENRTYDQVFGDVAAGQRRPRTCVSSAKR